MRRERSTASASARILLICIGNDEVSLQGKDSSGGRHLEHHVRIVWYGHELGQCWMTEDGMVGGAEISHQKADILNAKHLDGAK